MMPDLGKYADAVLSAYAVSILILLGVVVLTLIRGRRIRSRFDAIDAKGSKNG